MTVASGVYVHCFPSTDTEFRTTAQRLVAGSWERVQSTEHVIAEVQVALREFYPQATVRRRDAYAELGERLVLTFYAFRDG